MHRRLKLLWELFTLHGFVVLQFIILEATSLTAQCPPQCHCVPNRMSCEIHGLKRLPEPCSQQLESLLVENQTFDSTHLGPIELAVYRTPEFGGQVRLKSLYIRSCNIHTIGRNAFESLGLRLEMLDLTGNPLKHIADYAFAGLGQLTLILDKLNQPPAFDDHTFSGIVRIKSLIMRQSNLVTLPYQPLLQLTTEGKLDKLLLKGNQFRSLDSKYDAIFSELQDFEISGNSWNCDCQLTWLIRRHRIMLQKRSNPYVRRNRRWDNQMLNNWEMEDNQPKCAYPTELAGRNFSDLITDMSEIYAHSSSLYGTPKTIHCPPPQLESLDVLLETTRNRNDTTKSSRIQATLGKPAVQLRCIMKGSKYLQVLWRYHSTSSEYQNVHGTNDQAELRHSADDGLSRSESSITVGQIADTDTYSCLGKDVIGNVSTLVRIRWPISQTGDKTLPVIINTTPLPSNYSLNHAASDWSRDYLLPSDTFLHTPQFSLSQLMGAIVGTFISTVLLFLGIHCTLHWRSGSCKSRKTRKPELGSVGNANVSPAGTSSSNTSSSNTRLISSPKPSETSASILPMHLSPEAVLATKNFLNAHLIQQAMNFIPHADTPMKSEPSNLTNPMHPQMHIQTSTMAPGHNRLSVAYEPVAYSDVNNLTYEVPWVINSQLTNPAQFSTGHQLQAEQQIPLLFNNQINVPNQLHPMMDHCSYLPTTLQIPPPPSIPQPSLPGTSSTLTDTLNRTPSSGTNLMVLQAGYPNANHQINGNSTVSSAKSSS